MCNEKSRHPRLIHADANAEARYSRLRYFKFSIADAVSISDADFAVVQTFDREVFTKLAEDKITAAKKLLPVAVRIHLVHEYGAILATVPIQVGLPVANDIQLAHHLPSFNGTLPDGSAHSLAVPRYVAWKPDIH